MNYTDSKKIVVGGLLVLMVAVAVVFMLVGSKNLLAIGQPKTQSSTVADAPTPATQGQVLGESVQNPLKDIYINPFAK